MINRLLYGDKYEFCSNYDFLWELNSEYVFFSFIFFSIFYYDFYVLLVINTIFALWQLRKKDITKFVVTQSNDLIEANYPPELTAQSHKIARLILSQISPDDADMRIYKISMSTLKGYLGMSPQIKWGSFKKRFDESCSRLRDEVIEIEDGELGYFKAFFLSGWGVSKDGQFVEFEISSKLKPYLLELKKNYTSYLLAHIPKLRSGYSIRLYELLHQYRRIGKRKFELDDLQKKVGSRYKLYGDFKRKVILQAQKDLKKNTDLAFTFNPIKTGKKVTALEFVLFGNKPDNTFQQLDFIEEVIDSNDKTEPPALSAEILEHLNSIGINEQKLSKYLAKGFNVIKEDSQRQAAKDRCVSLNNYYLEKLELTISGAKKENPAGYLISALEGDWVGVKTAEKAKNTNLIEKKKEERQELSVLENQYKELKKQYESYRNPELEVLANNEIELNSAFDGIKSKGNYKIRPSETPLESYMRSPFISSAINLFFEEKYPERFEKAAIIFKKRNHIRKQIEKLKAKS